MALNLVYYFQIYIYITRRLGARHGIQNPGHGGSASGVGVVWSETKPCPPPCCLSGRIIFLLVKTHETCLVSMYFPILLCVDIFNLSSQILDQSFGSVSCIDPFSVRICLCDRTFGFEIYSVLFGGSLQSYSPLVNLLNINLFNNISETNIIFSPFRENS